MAMPHPAKDTVQLLHAHQVLVKIGVQRSHLPGIRVHHHRVEVERTSLKKQGLVQDHPESIWHSRIIGRIGFTFHSYRLINDHQVVAM